MRQSEQAAFMILGTPSEGVIAEVVLHGCPPLGLRPEAAADLRDLHQHGRCRSVQEIRDLLIRCRKPLSSP